VYFLFGFVVFGIGEGVEASEDTVHLVSHEKVDAGEWKIGESKIRKLQ
jgi:hypothetical protein